MCMICSHKVQGSFIAAPAWIGITLLFTNTSRHMAWAWEHAVALVCIFACCALIAYGLAHYSFSKENHERHRPHDQHPVGKLVGEHRTAAHIGHHRRRHSPPQGT